MQELDDIVEFIIETVSANAARGQNSMISVRITPASRVIKKAGSTKDDTALTNDDVIAAQEAFERFDGNFKRVFHQQ